MFDVREKPQKVERALLVGAYFFKSEEGESRQLLDELRELVSTLGIAVGDDVLLRVPKRNTRYLLGTGKTKEIIDYATSMDCDCIVFDNELSPAQQRNWEADADMCVIDRQEVILDIFADRAQTREAVLQVALARLEYSLPRLTRMWSHLDRQAGGVGARGEGETQLETDRRLARRRIDRVKRELAEVRTNRQNQRKERQRTPVPHAAIMGYTNAGKSSLLNRICGSEVLAEDKLFATLDTTTRKMDMADGQTLLLTDTVGFVRNLPHRLVEAFKATLEEALLTDFMIHVLDANQPEIFRHYQTTNSVLSELGAEDKPVIIVLNKMDLLTDAVRRQELENYFDNPSFVSAKTGEGVEELKVRLNTMIMDRVGRLVVRLPQSRHDLMSLLHREGKVLSCEYEGNDMLVEALLSFPLHSRYREFVAEPS